MLIGIIPDVHGNENVDKKFEILYARNVEHIVVLGDYVDSHLMTSSWISQKRVLSSILNEKLNKPDFITLLLGNHDFSYMSKYGSKPCSGHQWFQTAEIQDYLDDNLEQFQLIKVIDNWIFSHAGLSKTWLNNPRNLFKNPNPEVSLTLETVNQSFFDRHFDYCNFNGWDNYGDDITQGPTWIRPPSLVKDHIEGYNQCVGHTPFEDVDFGPDGNFWNIPERILNLEKETLVFLDSPDQSKLALIDTKTNTVEILGVE